MITEVISKSALLLLTLLVIPGLLGAFGAETMLCGWLLATVVVANVRAAEMQADYVCETQNACAAAPLPDRGLDWLGDHSEDMALVCIVDVMPVLGICALLATLYRTCARTRNVVLLSLSLFLAGRVLVMQATGLPPAKQGNASLLLVESSFANMLPDGHNEQGRLSHYDLMYSGHTGLFLLAILWILKLHGALDGPRRAAWLLVALAATAIEAAGLVAIRVHYTVDVLMGAIVAGLIFANASTKI